MIYELIILGGIDSGVCQIARQQILILRDLIILLALKLLFMSSDINPNTFLLTVLFSGEGN